MNIGRGGEIVGRPRESESPLEQELKEQIMITRKDLRDAERRMSTPSGRMSSERDRVWLADRLDILQARLEQEQRRTAFVVMDEIAPAFCRHGVSLAANCITCQRELDVKEWQAGLRLVGVKATDDEAERAWERYSESMSAKWLAVPPNLTREAVQSILRIIDTAGRAEADRLAAIRRKALSEVNIPTRQLYARVQFTKEQLDFAAGRRAGKTMGSEALFRDVNRAVETFWTTPVPPLPLAPEPVKRPEPAVVVNQRRGYFDE